MTNYQQTIIHHRRICILKLVAESSGTANDAMLRAGLFEWGLKCSRQGLKDDLKFLSDRNLVHCTDLKEQHMRIDITHDGKEVADGTVEVGGITPPSHLPN